MHAYHDSHGRLPPAVVYGKDGQPLYSWRVLLLPFLEQEDLYQQFRLDEPWDSPHNVQFLSRMPATYAPPGSKARLVPPGYTFCHIFTGKGTAFEEADGEQLSSSTGRLSYALLIVEAGEPVPWTKPTDFPYAADQPLPKLDGPFRDGFRAAVADGHVDFIGKGTSDSVLRALITPNGRDTPPDSP